MAKFTAPVDLNIRLPGGFEVAGAAGATHRIPDSLVEEFLRDNVPVIPGGVTWITQDETSGIPSVPLAQSDVTNLVSDLAGKAANVHSHAESSVTNLTTDLAAKFDKAGGIISGAVTATGAVIAQTSVSTPSMTATVARFKGGPWHDVRAYGALGDNAADDTSAIQAAIDAAGTGIIFFPPGTYKITAPLTVAAAATLRGAGARAVNRSIISQATASAIGISASSAADDLVVEDLTILGSATTANTAADGINAAKTCHLVRTQVKGFYNGLRVGSGAFYATILGAFFFSSVNAGIQLDSGMTNLFVGDGSRFFGGKYGIYGTGSVRGVKVDGATIEQASQYGVYIDGANASQIAVANVWFETTSAIGNGLGYIRLGANSAVKSVTITDNFFFPTDIANFFGIDASNTTTISINGNFLGTTGAGGNAYRFASTVADLNMGGNHYQAAIDTTMSSADSMMQFASGAWVAQAATTAGTVINSRVAGDIANRMAMFADGSVTLGPGNAARDTRIRRSAAKALQIDDGSGGSAALSLVGPIAWTPTSTQTLVAGTAIKADASVALISAASGITSTAAPTIASPNLDGQFLIVMNVGAQNITLQDQGTLASSNLRLTATQVVLGPRDSIMLVYVSAIADWIQVGSLVNVL